MRIGIDVRYLSHGLVGGVHNYVTYFVPALVSQAPDDQIFLYADTKKPFELADLPKNVTVRYLPWRSGFSSIRHDWRMYEIMAQDHLDIAHFPTNYGFGPKGARTVITLHDEINLMPWLEIVRGHPKKPRTIALMTYLHLCSKTALRNASLVLTVSEYSRCQIAHYSQFDPAKIVSVPHAPAPDLHRVESAKVLNDVRRRFGLESSFILADALKNPAVIIRAWQHLPQELRSGRQIVFFSRRPDPLPVVFQAVADGIACLLVRPDRSDLIALYSMAEVFVFPSWIEGFGLPLIEAMTCGTPVIASDRGSIPEVAGNAALLMDAEDDTALAAYLTRLFTSPGEVNSLRTLGFARAAQFSWERTARGILEGYQLALAG
jgi:glycosyltransferase involved in cell wall biosynthesis